MDSAGLRTSAKNSLAISDIDWERALLVPYKTERSKGANGVVAVSIIVYPRVLSGFRDNITSLCRIV